MDYRIAIVNSSSFGTRFPDQMDRLRKIGEVERVRVAGTCCGAELAKALEGFNVVISSVTPFFDKEFFENKRDLVLLSRHGIGYNNIDIPAAEEAGCLVTTVSPLVERDPVAEGAVAILLDAMRRVSDSHVAANEGRWAERASFVGNGLSGKTLGIIGLGAIGAKVANAAINLGMHVLGYDPYLSVDHALSLNTRIEHVTDLDDIFRQSDYITLHLHFNKSTANIIDQDAVSKMKGGVRIINLARGGLVSDDAIIEGLESGRVAKYITDFPDNRLVQTKNVVAMPHLGASTPESETNCAIMAADELRDYLENGNITNSVNLPNLTMRRSGDCRICVIHKNVPTVLSSIVKLFSDLEINVENLINKSKKELAYTMIDIDRKVGDSMIEAIEGLDNIIRVRILK